MTPSVPPNRHFPIPPGPSSHARPGRRGGSALPIVLLVVLAVALIGILVFGLVIRPALERRGGGSEAGSTTTEAAAPATVAPAEPGEYPRLKAGETLDWGPLPPANLGSFANAMGNHPPAEIAGFPLDQGSVDMDQRSLEADYSADGDYPSVKLLYWDNWAMYAVLVPDLKEPQYVGNATCGHRTQGRAVCFMVGQTGVLQLVSFEKIEVLGLADLATATQAAYDEMAADPNPGAWSGFPPPHLKEARGLAMDTLPRQIASFVADGEVFEFDGEYGPELLRTYDGPDGSVVQVGLHTGGHMDYVQSVGYMEAPEAFGDFVCDDLGDDLYECFTVGANETLSVGVHAEDGAAAAEVARQIYEGL